MANEANNEEELQNNEIDTSELDSSIDDLLGDYDDIESIINLLDSGKDTHSAADGAETASSSESDAAGTVSGSDSNQADKKRSAAEKKEAKKKAKEEKRLEKEKAKEAKQAEKERRKSEKASKKDTPVQEAAEAAAILNDTGSTSQDMENMDLSSDADSLLDELENLDNLDNLDVRTGSETEEDKAKQEKEELARKKKEEKAAKKKAKEEQKKAKAALKKQEKEKKKKDKPKKVKKPKEYVPEEKIRVSAVGIAFIFTVVVLVVFGVYFGSDYFNYNTNLKNASKYYMDKDYEKAYDALAGVKLKKADEGLYAQVLNIMQVKKHVDDFEAFLTARKYASALEALLRGIESYDENIMVSNELGTTEALTEVLKEITDRLQAYYGISIDEARNILLNEGRARSAVINEKSAGIVIPEETQESEEVQEARTDKEGENQ